MLYSAQQQVHDALELLLAQRIEDHNLIDTVDELWPERGAQRVHCFSSGALGITIGQLENRRGADVAGHHQNGVAEVHRAALAVREPAVFQDLQQHVENVGVCLLDFVEQNYGIRVTANLFGELAALLVADVAWGRADQARNAVFFHVFGHVDADHQLFVVEKKFGEGARQLGFADAGWPQENERADGPLGVGQTGAAATHRVRYAGQGIVLANHTLAQAIFHLHQFLRFPFQQAPDRNAGPLADQLGDVFLIDLFLEHGCIFLHRAEAFFGFLQLTFGDGDLAVADFRDLGEFAGSLIALGFCFKLLNLLLELANFAYGFLFGLPAGLARA